MKKIESILLAGCYLFTLSAVIRLCVAIVQDQTEFTFTSVASLVVLFAGLFALMLVAGLLLLTEYKKSQAKRRAKDRTF
jgi:hypothetical protein